MLRQLKRLISSYRKSNKWYNEKVRTVGRFTIIGKLKLDRYLFWGFAAIFFLFLIMTVADYYERDLHFYAECNSPNGLPCYNPFYERCTGETWGVCEEEYIFPNSYIGQKPSWWAKYFMSDLTVHLLVVYFLVNFVWHNRGLLKNE